MGGGGDFVGLILRGKSWERAQSWPAPQTDINYCLRSQDGAGEAQAGPVATVISPNCRRQTASPGTGSLCPQQEVFTKPGAWSGISRTSRQHVFPESSRVIKLAHPDERPGRPWLQSHGLAPICLCVCITGVWRQEMDGMPVSSRRHRKTYLPKADMYENDF